MDGLIPLVLVSAGLVLVAAGILSGLARSFRLGGPMPGDIRGQRGPVRFYMPLGLSLFISIALTLMLNAALCGAQR